MRLEGTDPAAGDQNSLLPSPGTRVTPGDLRRVEYQVIPQLNDSPVGQVEAPSADVVTHPVTEVDKTVLRTRGAFLAHVASYDAANRTGTVTDLAGKTIQVVNGLDRATLLAGDQVVCVFETGDAANAYVLGRTSGGTEPSPGPWMSGQVPGSPHRHSGVTIRNDVPPTASTGIRMVYDADGALGFGAHTVIGPASASATTRTADRLVAIHLPTGRVSELPAVPVDLGWVSDLTVHAGKLFAVATFGTTEAPYGAVARLDGPAWTVLGNSTVGEYHYYQQAQSGRLFAHAGDLFVVDFRIRRVTNADGSTSTDGTDLSLKRLSGDAFVLVSSTWDPEPRDNAPRVVTAVVASAGTVHVQVVATYSTGGATASDKRWYDAPLAGGPWRQVSAAPGGYRASAIGVDTEGGTYALGSDGTERTVVYTDSAGLTRVLPVADGDGAVYTAHCVEPVWPGVALVGGSLHVSLVRPDYQPWTANWAPVPHVPALWRVDFAAGTSQLVWASPTLIGQVGQSLVEEVRVEHDGTGLTKRVTWRARADDPSNNYGTDAQWASYGEHGTFTHGAAFDWTG